MKMLSYIALLLLSSILLYRIMERFPIAGPTYAFIGCLLLLGPRNRIPAAKLVAESTNVYAAHTVVLAVGVAYCVMWPLDPVVVAWQTRKDWLPLSKETIYGCEGRGDADSPYLTRYTLLKFTSWQLCYHVFHRSDADEIHDHPWDFITVPIVPYLDVTAKGQQLVRRFVPYYRKAEHQHRVQLLWRYLPLDPFHSPEPFVSVFAPRPDIDPAKWGVWPVEAKSLIVMFKRRREWGFVTKNGWLDWRSYFIQNRC